jgi:valyl-tRNA synthetase
LQSDLLLAKPLAPPILRNQEVEPSAENKLQRRLFSGSIGRAWGQKAGANLSDFMLLSRTFKTFDEGFGMSSLAKAYDAQKVESLWYRFWEERGFFTADPAALKKGYCIVIPPPNVTGVLHMGHALVNTLQDIAIRWRRMCGDEVLWLPGTDHAGIATQTVVERHLFKTLGKKRKDFSREEFLAHILDWKEKSEKTIIGQLKKLGCSCDWSRQRFTMDEGNNRAVRVMFKKLFDAGYIYQGDYLVNWDPVAQTALADDEVEHEEQSSFLWHFKYPLEDGSDAIEIATTRPETMLGDTAVAVSPKDERYLKFIGKKLRLPLSDRLIPIIADDYVDAAFGTGAVKITPAHDPNDYQMAERHQLPMINIMTVDGKINENGDRFAGLSMQEARVAVTEAMQGLGFFVKAEPHVNRVGKSYRSKAIVEPFLSKQWFIKMSAFKEKLKSAVSEDRVKLVPKNWQNTYFHWIDNLRDWCISRQLWWGHRIPIWYHVEDASQMLCSDTGEAPEEVQKNPHLWRQDDDVLDTWFSSGLWPFATLGWPDKTPELNKFYPTATLITGHDILFFWVARMIFFGEYAMEEVPFKEAYLHGLIFGKSYWREQGNGIAYVSEEERKAFDLGAPLPKDVKFRWEKMSKSKGNVIDPLEIIDEYGTDAMRMALTASASQAREIDLDRRRFEEFKNFANKVWNGARFVLANLEGDLERGQSPLTAEELEQGLDMSILRLEDRWIFQRLSSTIEKVSQALAHYHFDQAASLAYTFFWNDFCAYYVEINKPILYLKEGSLEERKNKQKILGLVLLASMRLLHPMAPFITEELFQKLKELLPNLKEAKSDPMTEEGIEALLKESCMISNYPKEGTWPAGDAAVEEDFAFISELVYAIRNIRGEMNIPPATAASVYLIGVKEDPFFQIAATNRHLLGAFTKIGSLTLSDTLEEMTLSSKAFVKGIQVVIPLPEELVAKERQRLAKEKEKLLKSVERSRQQLENPDFLSRAPQKLVDQQRATLQAMELELADIAHKLS